MIMSSCTGNSRDGGDGNCPIHPDGCPSRYERPKIDWDADKTHGGYIDVIDGRETMIMVKSVDGVICDHKGKLVFNPLHCSHCKLIGEEIFSRRIIGSKIPQEYFKPIIGSEWGKAVSIQDDLTAINKLYEEQHGGPYSIHYPPMSAETKKQMEEIMANLHNGKIQSLPVEFGYSPPSPSILSTETVREGDVLIYRYPLEGCNKQVLYNEVQRVGEHTGCKVILVPADHDLVKCTSIEELRAIREQVNTLIYDMENKK
jgi:hypothetical protein